MLQWNGKDLTSEDVYFMSESFSRAARSAREMARMLLRWLVLALPIGLLCGGVGTAFHLAVEAVTELRGAHGWLLWLLPAAGLAIVALYKGTKCEGVGTNNVIRAVQSGEAVSPLLVPAIFFGTVLTHLCGGSAGRGGTGRRKTRPCRRPWPCGGTAAVEQGQALPWDFICKILLTAITLASGFKGGEVVPSFYIGATFGCAFGPLLGLPAGFAAAVAMVAVFCGATNTLVPSLLLAYELFGGAGLELIALGCGLSYMLSGYHGLYSSQTFLSDKFHSEYTARWEARLHH